MKNMKLTLCGSIAFIDKMVELKKQFETHRHEVKIPNTTVQDQQGNPVPAKQFYLEQKKKANADDQLLWQRIQENINNHFEKIEWADAILVANYDKNDIKHYVGGNTLIEIGLAFYLEKHIYLLNPIPDMPYTEELQAIKPTILDGDLTQIKSQQKAS